MNAASITAAAALTSTVLVLLGIAGRWVFRSWKRIRDFLDDWGGAPQRSGVPERPGVMKRLENVEQAVEHIRAETRPNGGDSLRDKVDGAVEAITEVKGRVAEVNERVTGLTARVELFEQQRKHRETGDTR